MQRVLDHGTPTHGAAAAAPTLVATRAGVESSSSQSAANSKAGSAGDSASAGPANRDARSERDRKLVLAIMQRIESRLPGRVRDLSVRIEDEKIVLEGCCATYYSKQLAQHAALGVLEDEQLQNSIVVKIGH